jgi:hypothetical protein
MRRPLGGIKVLHMRILHQILASKRQSRLIVVSFSIILLITALGILWVGKDRGNLYFCRFLESLLLPALGIYLGIKLRTYGPINSSSEQGYLSNKEVKTINILIVNLVISTIGFIMFIISGELYDIILTSICSIIFSTIAINYHFIRFKQEQVMKEESKKKSQYTDGWICKICGYDNKGYRDYCEYCLQNR